MHSIAKKLQLTVINIFGQNFVLAYLTRTYFHPSICLQKV